MKNPQNNDETNTSTGSKENKSNTENSLEQKTLSSTRMDINIWKCSSLIGMLKIEHCKNLFICCEGIILMIDFLLLHWYTNTDEIIKQCYDGEVDVKNFPGKHMIVVNW